MEVVRLRQQEQEQEQEQEEQELREPPMEGGERSVVVFMSTSLEKDVRELRSALQSVDRCVSPSSRPSLLLDSGLGVRVADKARAKARVGRGKGLNRTLIFLGSGLGLGLGLGLWSGLGLGLGLGSGLGLGLGSGLGSLTCSRSGASAWGVMRRNCDSRSSAEQ